MKISGWFLTRKIRLNFTGRHIIRYGIVASLFLHLSVFGFFFFYLKFAGIPELSLAELESRSLDVDFIDDDQLRRMLMPEPEPEPVIDTKPVEPEPVVEEVVNEEEQIEEEEPVEEEPIEEEPAEEEIVEEEESDEDDQLPPVEEEVAVESEPEEPPTDVPDEVEPEEDIDLEIEIPGEDSIDAPEQKTVIRDDLYEIETIKSAVPVKKAKQADIKTKFSSVLKDFSVDLGKRSKSISKKTKNREKELTSEKRVEKVKTILTDNRELFKKRQIVAKWKHFPLSRIMLREYIPEVNKAIKPYWNLPLEMDPTLEILVKLKISKSGKILDYEFVESSRNRFFNHSVVQVFKNLDHLPPLPEGFKGESTEIGLRFTSKQINNE